MTKIQTPTKKVLRIMQEFLEFNELTGVIKWTKTRSPMKVKGSIAGYKSVDGYTVIGVDKKTYKAHRIGWFLHYGVWPNAEIDHINGDKTDNRIQNLRLTNKYENQHNQFKHRQGLPVGVSQKKSNKKWQATLPAKFNKQNKQKYIGIFETKEEAIQAIQNYIERTR